MKDTTKEYLKQFASNKDHYKKTLDNWTDAELAEHYKELDAYYGRSIRTENLLGRFEDKSKVYYWHLIDDNNPVKLEKRLSIGYSIVQSEEEVGMKRSQDSSRLGSSSVVKDMKGGNKAVLLQIPKELYDLNQEIKQRKSNQQALFDHNGNPLKVTVKSDTQRMVTHIDAGLKDPFEVDNSKL
jgi:hypothetical protein